MYNRVNAIRKKNIKISQFAILSKFLKSLEIWSRFLVEPFTLVFKNSSCVNVDEGVTGEEDVDDIIGGATCSVFEFNNLNKSLLFFFNSSSVISLSLSLWSLLFCKANM